MYFFLIILGILLNFHLDISYKQDKFFKNWLKKGLKFVLSKRNNNVVFNLSLILLPVKANLSLKRHSIKMTRLELMAPVILK